MPKFTPKRYEQLLQQMLSMVVTRGGLYDVGDSAAIKHTLAAVARALDEAYYQASLLRKLFSIDTATGSDLDDRAREIQPATIVRMVGTPAVGQVIFSRQSSAGTVTIPAGTQVKTADGVVFLTTAVGTITPTSPILLSGHALGQDSPVVPVTAQVPGSAGNVVAGTVVKFVQKPGGVSSVTNATPFAQGRDQETDDAFRQRLKTYVASLARSTVQALESGVLGAQDPVTSATIIFSKAVEDLNHPGFVTLYVDDGTGQAQTLATVVGENLTAGIAGPPPGTAVGGETRLTLLHRPINTGPSFTVTSTLRGALTLGTQVTLDVASGLLVFSPALSPGEGISVSYTYFTGLVALAQKIIDGDPNDRTNFPGMRAAGVQVTVRTPQVVLISIVATITIATGFDPTTVRAAAKQAVLAYVDSLGISGDVLRATLFQRVMNVPGVANVTINTPAQDVAILDNQLARITTDNVTIN